MLKVLLAVCMAVVLSSPAFAQMQDMPMEHRAHGHMEKCETCNMENGEHHHMGDLVGKCLQLADKLGLSEDQINKIKPIHREMKKKQIRFKADLEIAKIEMMQIVEVKDFDLEKATAQLKKMEDMKVEHHVEMLKAMKEVRSILTDEQFKKMKDMMHMKKEGCKLHKHGMKNK